ncbi:SDR family NAD(P)-dependent oxidoreductase [Cyanobium sp. Alchichica 3B3-8F6]|uniref:SDR family NAD(P)-dependent oxidoreductase n=1 Tax=Cyanobium sp. Alchichica 3B3-8F6 TaxID=2823696 RepID=UPI0020CD605A|nr:SDR family NAD(P)-dependent oxidoreductase [Cyanobium sp. Alchichica 3B3-8F6]MCP9882009.1 SDR family NAD(P)-dependent oxidoreductase [Cyanobium sp. Alchichica 3B3-8F6]
MGVEECSAGATRHILLTGGSSGIGFQAAILLLQAGHRLTLPCRDANTAAALRQRLGGRIETPICDLADLSSIKRCAESLLAEGEPIDTLVLNAGLQYSGGGEPRWSAQGFELTIAVNHLGHQALLQQLLPLLMRGTAPRLVVTASEVHDPTTAGGKVGLPAGLGDLAGLRQGPGALLLDGSGSFNAEKAYKDSKLCNLLMAREAERRLREQGAPLPVLAWSPGLVIPRSKGGFFRYSRSHNPVAQALFALVARDLLRLTETPQRAGTLLAGLASTATPQPSGFQYWSNRVLGPGRLRFEASQPSGEACSDTLALQLWDLSAQIGIG